MENKNMNIFSQAVPEVLVSHEKINVKEKEYNSIAIDNEIKKILSNYISKFNELNCEIEIKGKLIEFIRKTNSNK